MLSIGRFFLGSRCKGTFTESEPFGIVNQQALLVWKTTVELLEQLSQAKESTGTILDCLSKFRVRVRLLQLFESGATLCFIEFGIHKVQALVFIARVVF